MAIASFGGFDTVKTKIVVKVPITSTIFMRLKKSP